MEHVQEVDREPPRPPPQSQPMGQRHEVGNAHPPLPPHLRIPLAGGPHRPRHRRVRRRRRPIHAPPIRLPLRGSPRHAGGPGRQKSLGTICWRRGHLHDRGAHAERMGPSERDVAFPRAEFRQGVRRHVPGRDGSPEGRLGDQLGSLDETPGRVDHDPLGRRRSRLAPQGRAGSGRGGPDPSQEERRGGPKGHERIPRRPRRGPEGRRIARQGGRSGLRPKRRQVLRVGEEGSAPEGGDRTPGRVRGRLHLQVPSGEGREGERRVGERGGGGRGGAGRHAGSAVRGGEGATGRGRDARGHLRGNEGRADERRGVRLSGSGTLPGPLEVRRRERGQDQGGVQGDDTVLPARCQRGGDGGGEEVLLQWGTGHSHGSVREGILELC
mmetsp:Transcript_25403/g.51954  ORF Transcript_25403/g.51954 Transcript_25403/m.51954 type:complete len:383 (-) Transcript_25403:103-1251(-)